MKYLLYIFLFLVFGVLIACFALRGNDGFKTGIDFVSIRLGQSKTVEEVQAKYADKVRRSLGDNEFIKENGLPKKVLLFANKTARALSLYAEVNGTYSLIKTYPFTAFSGKLGAKHREGDLQIPEGVYKIESFNPNSLYHLALRVNYPNDFDKAKGLERAEKNLGGDIMIHGRSCSVGCIAIGDDAIEEVFLMCANAKDNGIDVVIVPDLLLGDNFKAGDVDESKAYAELIEILRTEMQKYEKLGVKF